jgi:hypothetical protein
MGKVPSETEWGSQVTGTGDITAGYAALIRMALSMRKTSTRALQRAGIINDRTRRVFFDKLDRGQLTISELREITRYLQIDPMRALIAVAYMNDSAAYFNSCCETVATMAEELTTALQERLAAAQGDFTAIHRNLCKVQASKLAKDIADHSDRANHYRENGFD